MWEKAVVDLLGRTVRTETPAFGGGTEITANEYGCFVPGFCSMNSRHRRDSMTP